MKSRINEKMVRRANLVGIARACHGASAQISEFDQRGIINNVWPRALIIGIAVICILAFWTAAVDAQILDSFTEPYQTIQLSAAEPGRVETVHVKLGDPVSSGELILSLDNSVLQLSREIAQANVNTSGNIDFARSELEIKTNRLEKLRSVQSNGFAGLNELEMAKSELASAQARLQTSLDERDLNRLEVKRIDAQIEQRRVRSRIDGVIIELLHKPGEYVSVSAPQTAVVADLSRLRAKFHLTTAQAAKLKENQVVQLEMSDDGKTISGTIEYISPVTSAKSLTVRVDVVISNARNKTRSGIPIRLMINN